LTQSDQDRLWGEVISLRNLDEAWARVRSNGGCSGGDGLTVERFQKNAALRLTDLSKALREGTYLPAAIRQVDIPKKKGGHRRLLIPSLLDRILHTAIAQVITPILDPTFEDSSFAYRPGRSVDQAVRTIETWRKEGYWHVIEADIVGYFDAIRHDQLLGKLELALKDHVGSDAVVSIVAHWFEHLAQHTGTLGKGVAQGSPLSPILANLYLDELDEALHGKGVRLVRFADDFVILCKKRKTAEAALEDATKLLADHGLELHRDGTRVIDFDRGFEFLGRLFVRSFVLQSVADPEDDVVSFLRSVDVQDRQAEREATALAATIEGEKAQGYDRGDRVLYLSEPGRKLTLQNLSFSVEAEDGHQLIVLAHDRVDRIEVGTGVVMDANVIRHASLHRRTLFWTRTDVWRLRVRSLKPGYAISARSCSGSTGIGTQLMLPKRSQVWGGILGNWKRVAVLASSWASRAWLQRSIGRHSARCAQVLRRRFAEPDRPKTR